MGTGDTAPFNRLVSFTTPDPPEFKELSFRIMIFSKLTMIQSVINSSQWIGTLSEKLSSKRIFRSSLLRLFIKSV